MAAHFHAKKKLLMKSPKIKLSLREMLLHYPMYIFEINKAFPLYKERLLFTVLKLQAAYS